MEIRSLEETDYSSVISAVNDWWNGRQMAHLLPRLFFQHFQTTSFVIEDNKDLVTFLIGFISQTNPGEAYIHFVGVHPDYRSKGLARQMYEKFFSVARTKGCHTVRSITSPVNKQSIAFHQAMGFQIKPGEITIDGIPVSKDYDCPGEHRVLFFKIL